jgi:hypothetical protein
MWQAGVKVDCEKPVERCHESSKRAPSGRIGEKACDAVTVIPDWEKLSINCDYCFTSWFKMSSGIQKVMRLHQSPPFDYQAVRLTQNVAMARHKTCSLNADPDKQYNAPTPKAS